MANGYEASGTIRQIMETKTLGNGFVKREFVLTTEDDYPQVVLFECVKQRTSLLDGVAVNDRVTVTFRIRGRAWQERFFVNLEVIDVARVRAAGAAAPAMNEQQGASAAAPSPFDEDPPF